MLTGKSILVVTAHPDDETLCSGALAKLVEAGNFVTLVVGTSGNRGSITPAIRPEALALQRQQEMAEAAEVLGIQDVRWLGYEDGRLYCATDLKERVFRAVREVNPDIVFSFDPERRYDFHSDHRTIGEVTVEAVYLRRCCWYYPQHAEAGQRVDKPIELYLYQPERANYQVDVSRYVKQKLASGIKHRSQSEDSDIKRMMRLERILRGANDDGDLQESSVADYLTLMQDLCFERFCKVYDTDYCI